MLSTSKTGTMSNARKKRHSQNEENSFKQTYNKKNIFFHSERLPLGCLATNEHIF